MTPLLLLAASLAQSPTALKTTIRMSIVQADSTPATPADGKQSPYGNFGPLIKQLLTPDGPVTIDYVISGDQSRAEVKGRLATLPQGSVVLQRLGEDTIRVLNPANKTWYEIPSNQNLGTILGTPDVTIEPAGEQTTIAGQRAERFRFKETLHIPVPEGSSLPSDFPKDLDLSGDLWSTDAFSGSAYAAVFRTLQAFAAIPGVEALTSGGRFPLRIALRSSIMPGYEVRSEVTAIGSVSADPAQFTVPSGFIKVQGPGGDNSQLHTFQRPMNAQLCNAQDSSGKTRRGHATRLKRVFAVRWAFSSSLGSLATWSRAFVGRWELSNWAL